jgi:hypothetical protein
MTPEDVAMVLLSGHGMNDDAGAFHFLPHDANLKTIHLRRTCVGYDYIKETLLALADRGKTAPLPRRLPLGRPDPLARRPYRPTSALSPTTWLRPRTA